MREPPPGADAARMAQLFPGLDAQLDPTRPATDLEPDEARFLLFDGVVRFVHAIAQVQPLLLVLDDLHWADSPSLQLLEMHAARPLVPIQIEAEDGSRVSMGAREFHTKVVEGYLYRSELPIPEAAADRGRLGHRPGMVAGLFHAEVDQRLICGGLWGTKT